MFSTEKKVMIFEYRTKITVIGKFFTIWLAKKHRNPRNSYFFIIIYCNALTIRLISRAFRYFRQRTNGIQREYDTKENNIYRYLKLCSGRC